MNLPCRVFAVTLLFTCGAVAQHEHDHDSGHATKVTKWKMIGELGIAGTGNDVVATGIGYMKAFIAAGVEDGEDDRWCNQVFMTKDTLSATPLRFRFLRKATEKGRLRKTPFLLLDYEKEIDFGDMFANMQPRALDGDNRWALRGVNMCQVKRPNGGFRLNFGGTTIFGDKPEENPLFTTYSEPDIRPLNEKLMVRLRQMPIHGTFDFRLPMNDRENKEIAGLFGPRAALLSASISTLAKRPVLDLYSGMRAGEGIVGQYMNKRPGHARLLGSLSFEPGFVLAADLGDTVPRSLLTLARGLPRGSDAKDVFEPLTDLLDSWTGEITVVGASKEPPPKLDRDSDVDLDAVFAGLLQNLHGTLLFGIEEGSGKEIVKSLEAFLTDAAKEAGERLEVIEGADGRAFKVPFMGMGKEPSSKFVVFGSSERLFTISAANSILKCRELRRGSLAKKSTVPLPNKLGMAQGPVKLWVQKGMLRYVGAWYRAVRKFVVGSSSKNRGDWIQDVLEKELLSQNLAASLSWTTRFGTMLRVQF